MTLENLIGKLLEQIAPDPQGIQKLLAAAARNIEDSKLEQLSDENRFDVAYKAIMQLANAALQANGFIPVLPQDAGFQNLGGKTEQGAT